MLLHAPALTSASTSLFRSMYERFYGELPPEQHSSGNVGGAAKQAALEERVKQLIMRKDRGAGPQALPTARPSGSGGSGGAPRQPGRMVTAVSTMPGQKLWIAAPARPAGSSGGAPLTRRHSDENEQPGGGRHYHATQQPQPPLAAQQEDGKLWRPQEAPRPSVSMQASQGRSMASRGSGGNRLSGLPASAVLQRQIELKAALRPPAVEQPHKSPWRPPGGRQALCRH